MSKAHSYGRLRVPSLNPLRAFEAAARHMSFTTAALELSVTQGAVSRSVKALEDHLGLTLFERAGANLALTEGGQEYAKSLTEAFSLIEQATDVLVSRRAHTILTICGYTSFLVRWLIPRLPDFQRQHPDVEVRLISANDRVNPNRNHVDIRIRYGRGRWREVESIPLFADDLRPVCSTKLLDPRRRPYTPEILANYTLLEVNARPHDWSEWLAASDVAGDVQPSRKLYFEELSIAYECAINGLGMAMGQRPYLSEELESGRLFEPFETVLHRDLGYHLTYPTERKDVPVIRAFREWIARSLASKDR